MLEATDLWKAYGGTTAVAGISLALRPGETLGLLGPNGAGKSTTVGMLCGLTPPDRGTVTIDGVPLAGDESAAKRCLGVVPQDVNQLYGKASKDHVNFIDKFLVPSAAKSEFYERMQMNRSLLKKLPGFLGDEAYEYTDNDGNLICVTIAHWANKEVVAKAKEAVQAEYKREGFDMQAMLKRLNITIDRALYSDVGAH